MSPHSSTAAPLAFTSTSSLKNSKFELFRLPRSTCVSRSYPSASLTFTQLGPIPDVSQVAIGTWSWGNKLLFNYDPSADSQLQNTFEEAVTRGVSLFDTADSYGTGQLNGRAELLLGRFLRAHPSLMSDVKIATKYASYPWRLTRGSIVEAAARSAERLGRPADIGQIHWSASRYAPWQERALWDGLADAKEQGFCRQIGVSNFGSHSLERIVEYLRDERGVSLASAQVQVSLLSRVHTESGGVVDTARQLGVGTIGYSPLCLGLLSGKYSNGQLPKGLRSLIFASINPRNLLDTMHSIAQSRNVTVAQIAIAWCLSKKIVVLVGARSPKQVQDSILASDIVLTKDEIQRLEESARSGRQMIQNAFQTK